MECFKIELRARKNGFQEDGLTPIKTTCLLVHIPTYYKNVFEVFCNDYKIPTQRKHGELYINTRYFDGLMKWAIGLKIQIVDPLPLKIIKFVMQYDDNHPRVPVDTIIAKIGIDTWNQLRVYQQTAVKFAIRRQRVLIADDQGTGKTAMCLATLKYFEDLGSILIVCPSTLRNTWKMEMKKWIQRDAFVLRASKQLAKLPNPLPKYIITSYDLLKTVKLLPRFHIIVLDESHFIKNYDSKRSKLALSLLKFADIRIMMSGTPFSYPSQLYPQLYGLYPELFPYFVNKSQPYDPNSFSFRYCHPVLFQMKWIYNGTSRPKELSALLSKFMIRRTKEQVLPFLPMKNRTCIALDEFNDAQYKDIELANSMEERDKNEFMASYRLTCTYKRESSLRFISEYIMDTIMEPNPNISILIWFVHTDTRKAIETLCTKRMPDQWFSIYGGVKEELRNEYVRDFQAGNKYRIGILSLQSCATGLTLTRATIIVFAELLFSPTEMVQAEDRIHRLGQTQEVTIYYLLAPETTDELVWNLICKKEKIRTLILDDKSQTLKANQETIAKRVKH